MSKKNQIVFESEEDQDALQIVLDAALERWAQDTSDQILKSTILRLYAVLDAKRVEDELD